MRVETRFPTDIKQTPFYWDSHGEGDECFPGEPLSTYLTDVEKKRIKETLNKFFKLKKQKPLRTFDPGEEFIGSTFPAGSVISFERELLSLPDLDYGNPSLLWGVTVLRDEELILAEVYDNCIKRDKQGLPIQQNRDDLVYRVHPNIKVGKVTHDIVQRPVSDYNMLNRVTKLYLWDIGQATPDKQRRPSSSPIRGFSPQFG